MKYYYILGRNKTLSKDFHIMLKTESKYRAYDTYKELCLKRTSSDIEFQLKEVFIQGKEHDTAMIK